jgi:hypothetical protein
MLVPALGEDEDPASCSDRPNPREKSSISRLEPDWNTTRGSVAELSEVKGIHLKESTVPAKIDCHSY